ncbi:MAG: hypothetical protein RI894_2657, partial [Bacteroidota bacterium]
LFFIFYSYFIMRFYQKLFFLFAISLAVASCETTKNLKTVENKTVDKKTTDKKTTDNLAGQSSLAATTLFQPLQLNPDTTTVYAADFFTDVSEITSISSKDVKVSYNAAKHSAMINTDEATKAVGSLVFTTKNNQFYSVPLKKSMKVPVFMVFDDGGKGYKKVQLAGDMNNWQPAMSVFTNKNKGAFKIRLLLNPGNYSYQLVADDKWMLDPNNPKKKDNGSGGMNSVLEVPTPAPSELPHIATKNFNENSINIAVSDKNATVLAFWQNKPVQLTPIKSVDTKSAYYSVAIPADAGNMMRSFIRFYGYNEKGIGNDVLIPLAKGIPVTDSKDLTRFDKEAQSMYFTLVDRFQDGDKTNNHPLIDARISEKENFQGGDLKGITLRLKSGYFDKLGINTLWVSPIPQQPNDAWQEFPAPRRFYSGYHGYWPVSSTKIDYRFGTDADLTELVTEAHKRNMNVILDFVAHHVHKLHPLYKAHPDQVTPFTLPDGRKNLRIWDEQRLTTWFDDFLPTLNLTNEEVAKIQVDSAMFWMEKFNLDGFRHDACKHIPNSFWRKLTTQMKTRLNRPYYQIGETFGSRELIQSYIGTGLIDGQFDFNLYFDAREVFGKKDVSFKRMESSLLESFNYYGWHSTMGNITGNHDLVRFMGLASDAVSWTEDGKEAGYSRKITVKDTIAYNRLSMLTAFLMTTPGIPIFYYGDEIGMVGAGDPDNRRMMQFNNWNAFETRTKAYADKLTTLRKTHIELLYGDYVPLYVTDDVWVFARHYLGKTAIVGFNKSDTTQAADITLPDYIDLSEVKAQFGSQFGLKDHFIELNLPAHTFEILLK